MRTSAEIQTINLGNVEISYTERGSGEPIMLVHAGVFADWFLPMAASPTLDDFRVIRVIRAGYGLNSTSLSFSIQDCAKHLADLAASLRLDRFHVAGHSSGALIALQLAADYPAMVQSLALIEPAPLGPFQVPAFAELGQRFIGPAIAAFANGDLPTAFRNFMTGVGGDDYGIVLERSLGSEALEDAVRQSRFFFRDEIPATMQWQFGPADVDRVRQPVLVVEGAAGRRSGALSQEVTESALKLFPRAELALIENANHMLPLQEPHALGRVLADFARRNRMAPS
jgi:pimeloyl-ACP methyl ester carboxylesterase